MSSMEMSSLGKFAYHRLKHEIVFDDEREGMIRRSKNWYRFRRIPIRRRFRLKVPSLRRFWRKKARVVSAMRISCAKVMRRLKEGQGHFGDVFAGNYMFMQISPSSLKCLDKGHRTNGFTPSFSLPKIAY
ncbi:hypothetical protein L6164_005054 [Bauhinia variegata]|uniref:Uncharacterized protein n=1 Tax=Bauhinia variegata TaxID=167791 RepID=A0ACB9PP80_BAUVA|nr:hypothetical protein L6164_005054 [Bauhinia variegata]